MKRQLIVKCLLVAAIALTVVGAWADVIPNIPLPPRALTYAEWTKAMRQDSILLRLTIPCSFLVIFFVVLTMAVRRKRPSYLVWLACFVPAVLCVPLFRETPWKDFAFFSVVGVSATSWLISILWFLLARRRVKGVCALIVIPIVFFAWWLLSGGLETVLEAVRGEHYRTVLHRATSRREPRLDTLRLRDGRGEPVWTVKGETYEEYLERVNRIKKSHFEERLKHLEHLCPCCNAPMKSGYVRMRYWYCDSCGYGKKDYEDALNDR